MTESSLRNFDRLSDRIRLHRQARSEAIVVVEGPTDEWVFRRVVLGPVDVFRSGSRTSALQTAHECWAFGLRRIVFIVDRDFDDAVDDAVGRGLPVAAYDSSDLEAMLVLSSALDHLLREFGSEQKVDRFGGFDTVRRSIIEEVRPIACLRRLNAEESLGLAFDAVNPASKMKVSAPAIRLEPYVDALIATSSGEYDRAALLSHARSGSIRTCSDSGTPLFRGRDALAVLGVLLRRILGGLSADQAADEALAQALRLAADTDELRSSPWYQRVLNNLDRAS